MAVYSRLKCIQFNYYRDFVYIRHPSIKGFALTLGIGILISMFTAITVTRTFLKVFIGNNILTHPWLFGVSKIKPAVDLKIINERYKYTEAQIPQIITNA